MFCSKCGTQIAERVAFCSKCGRAAPNVALSTSNEPNAASRGWIWLLIVPIGIIILGVVLSTPTATERPATSTASPVERTASTGNLAHDQMMARTEGERALLLGKA